MTEQQQEQTAPVDWEAIVRDRERELKQVGEARHRAETERDTARQHAAAIAAQRDRLRQRMNNLADRWDAALAVDKPYARALRAEISCAPFEPEACLAVQQYRADNGTTKWAFRCWGTDICDGWLSLGHDTERWAEIARDRHVAEDHTAPESRPSCPDPVECGHEAALADAEKRAEQLEDSLSVVYDTSNRSEAARARAEQRAAELRVRLNDAEAGITAAIRQRKTAEDRSRRAEAALTGIRDAARLHRQQLISTSELYAAIEALDQPEPAPALLRAARLADLAREILYASHNISSQDWARWRETLDNLTEQQS